MRFIFHGHTGEWHGVIRVHGVTRVPHAFNSGGKLRSTSCHTRARPNTDFLSNPPRKFDCYGIKQIDRIFPWSILLHETTHLRLVVPLKFWTFMTSFYGLLNNYSTSARWIWDIDSYNHCETDATPNILVVNGISALVIHQIFFLTRDWTRRVTWPNIPQLELGIIREYTRSSQLTEFFFFLTARSL